MNLYYQPGERVEPETGRHTHLVVNYRRQYNKNGKLGAWKEQHCWATKLFICEVCGMRSTAKRVCVRNDVYGWSGKPAMNTLCVACWNKARAIMNKANEYEDIKTIMNKIKRRITDARRDQDHGKPSSISG